MSYRLQCTQQFQRKNLTDGRRGTCRVEKQMYLFKQAEWELVARDLYTAPAVHIIQAKQNCVMGVIGGGDWEGMELKVGSNIMILFSLHIAASHMAHVLFRVCVYYTLLVVIIICIMFVKLFERCWRMW